MTRPTLATWLLLLAACAAAAQAANVPLPIHTVQGAGATSTYEGQDVTVDGVVTGRLADGFFVQATDATRDADDATSEGIFVWTGPSPPAAAVEGNLVRVSGTVEEARDPGVDIGPTRTQLSYRNLLVLATSQPLPAPITMLAAVNEPYYGPGLQMEKLEGMRVISGPSLRVSSPTDGVLSLTTGRYVGNGTLYLAPFNSARRKPGLPPSMLDPSGSIPHRPADPERIRVESLARQGTLPIVLDATDGLEDVVGVLDQRDGARALFVEPNHAPTIALNSRLRPIAEISPVEAGVAAVVLDPFFDDNDDPTRGEPVMAPAAFDARANLLANALHDQSVATDLLVLTGVENSRVLERIARQLNQRAYDALPPLPRRYDVVQADGVDLAGVGIGILMDVSATADGGARVEVVGSETVGADARMPHPDGSDSPLFDRPSLLVRALVHGRDGKTAGQPLTVLALSLYPEAASASLATGVRGWPDRGAEVRARRAAQALWLADYIEARQIVAPDEKLLVTGDFQASGVVDGMVDVVGILRGNASQAVLLPVVSPITRPLAVLDAALPEPEAYDRVVSGEQVLHSHMLATAPLVAAAISPRVELARINADWAAANAEDYRLSLRTGRIDPMRLALSSPLLARTDVYVTQFSNQHDAYAPAEPQEFRFDFGVGNHGPGPGQNWVLDITLSRPVAFELDRQGAWTCTPTLVAAGQASTRCTANATPAPQPLSELPITVVFTTVLNDTADYVLTAHAQSDALDTNLANNTETAVLHRVTGGDLAPYILSQGRKIVPGTPFDVPVVLANLGPGTAQGTTLDLTINVGSGVSVTSTNFDGCQPPVAAGGTTTIHCSRATMPMDNSSFVDLQLQTSAALTGDGVTVQLVAGSSSVDHKADNNRYEARFALAATADLCVSLDTFRCEIVSSPVPYRILPGGTGRVTVSVRNRSGDTARNARLDIYSNVGAARFAARIRSGAACVALPVEYGYDRISCALGNLAPGPAGTFVDVDIDAADLAGGDKANLTAYVSSDATDSLTFNDTISAEIPVAMAVDLSARVLPPKGSLLPRVASDFIVIARADGPRTDAVSLVTFDITGDFEFLSGVELVTPGWVCGYMRIVPPNLQARCTRLVPLAPGEEDVLTVRTTPRFTQVGKSIRVMATHHYLPISSAFDPASSNDSAAQTVVVGGRSTGGTGTRTKPAMEFPRKSPRPLPQAPTPKHVGLPSAAGPLPACIDGAADVALVNADGSPVVEAGCRRPRPN